MNLTQATLRDLRELIVGGELAPGSLVTESWVCRRFAVARPTAKSALDRLVAEGVLQREVNRAARVPVFSVSDVDDLYESRLVIEAEAIARVATAGVVAREMRRAHRLMTVSLDEPADFIAADVAFHRARVQATGSPRLVGIHDSLIGETEICMARVRSHDLLGPQAVVDEHHALVEAIERQDAAGAVRLLRHHIRWAKDAIAASLLDPVPFAGLDP